MHKIVATDVVRPPIGEDILYIKVQTACVGAVHETVKWCLFFFCIMFSYDCLVLYR